MYVKLFKEKVVIVKVVLFKKEFDVFERNYFCMCEWEWNIFGVLKDDFGDVEEINFNEIMKVFLKYFEDFRKELIKILRNVVKGF